MSDETTKFGEESMLLDGDIDFGETDFQVEWFDENTMNQTVIYEGLNNNDEWTNYAVVRDNNKTQIFIDGIKLPTTPFKWLSFLLWRIKRWRVFRSKTLRG